MNLGSLGLSTNEIQFSYNNFINWDILLVLDSLDFIADGLHTLDNRRPVLPFNFAGRELADNEYMEGAYDEDGYGFASWRLGYGYLWRICEN